VLRSILLALEEQGAAAGIRIVPIVLSADPAWTSSMYNVEAVRRMHPGDVWKAIRSSDGLISGGGSLLQDATGTKTIPYYTGVIKLAQLLGKPTFIYSQGIGPVNRRWMDPLIRNVMKRSAYVSVRDQESSELLVRIGVPQSRIQVVPDPVMGLPLPGNAASQQAVSISENAAIPTIGVSLRFWRSDRADMVRAADALALLASRRPVRLRFLPFHTPDDVEASKFVMERLEGRMGEGSVIELAAALDDPQRMLLEVSRCNALFGMRLHALIYAANQRVPMLGLSYDPKIDQFLQRLDLRAVGTADMLDAVTFADTFEQLLDDLDGWKRSHHDAIEKLRQQSQQPAQQITQLLRQNLLR